MTAALRLNSSIVLATGEFEQLRRMIYDTFGVALSHEKSSMVQSRLQPVLAREGLGSFSDYIALVQRDRSRRLLSEMVNRISTNHTFFNRESSHFEIFVKRALPAALDRSRGRSPEIRVWCAASSTGQEPYTLAASMMHSLGHRYAKCDAGVLATDINDEVLRFAQAGVYERNDLAQLPPELRGRRFFRDTAEGKMEATAELKREVLFRRFNLVNPRFPFKRPFDVIFCRNVMIYFDEPTKRALVERMCKFLYPGGYLFIGSAESIPSAGLPLQNAGPAVFRRV